MLDEALRVAADIGDDWVASTTLPLRGAVAMVEGNLGEATRSRRGRASRLRGSVLPGLGLGKLALMEVDTDEAERRFLTVLDLVVRSGPRGILFESLDGLAFVAAARGEARAAVQLFAAVDTAGQSIKQARAR